MIPDPNFFEGIIQRLNTGIVIVDQVGHIQFWNQFMKLNSGHDREDVLGKSIYDIFPEIPQSWFQKKIDTVFTLQHMAFTDWKKRPYVFRFPTTRPITGEVEFMYQNCTFSPLINELREVAGVLIVVTDITEVAEQTLAMQRLTNSLEQEKREQQKLITKLEEAQNQLLQSEKMAAIGQLAAGVAHEINNPTGFVYSNMGSLGLMVEDLMAVIDVYEEQLGRNGVPEAQQAIQQAKEKYDFDYLKEDLVNLVKESKDGIERIKRIVEDLKGFSHVGESEWQMADIHKGLESTLNVVWNEVKYKAEVEKHFADLPEVECIPSQINQVFMNLVVNAAHSIEKKGKITISTGQRDNQIFISVADTGCGISREHLNRIFEPFFTTKPVGKGTGLGLSVSYNIIKKHHGHIEVDSTPGEGTTFVLWLPVKQPELEPEQEKVES